MNETSAIEKWIYAKCTADTQIVALAAGGIHGYRVPENSTFPLVLFTFLTSTDTPGNAAIRLLTRQSFQIKCIQKGNLDGSEATIADRIDFLFQNAMGVVYGGNTFSSRRTQQISYVEQTPQPETYYRHLGGLYRIDCY